MTRPKDNDTVSHFIRLLDDRDEFVRTKVREKLIQIGEDALSFLHILTRTENPSLRILAGEIIHSILPGQPGGKFRRLRNYIKILLDAPHSFSASSL